MSRSAPRPNKPPILGSFPRPREAEALTTLLHLEPGLRMNGVTTVLPQYTFTAWRPTVNLSTEVTERRPSNGPALDGMRKICLPARNLNEAFAKRLGRDSSVGIATRYWLDCPGIEFRWGRDFSAPVQTEPGTHPASYIMGTGSFLLGKSAGACRLPRTPSSAEVEGRVELYICSSSGPSWPVLGRTLTFYLSPKRQQ